MSIFLSLNEKTDVLAATFKSGTWASMCSNVSVSPSEKYSSSFSPLKFSNGKTAIELKMRVSASCCCGSASCCRTNLSTSKSPTAKIRIMIMDLSSMRPVRIVSVCERSISFSFLIPSGVSSKTQARIKAIGKPTNKTARIGRPSASSRPRIGKTTSTNCKISQPTTRYAVPTRKTLRRLNSAIKPLTL